MTFEEAFEKLENDRNVSFKDLLGICKQFFEGPRNSGSSHYVFRTPWAGKPWVNIQKDGKMAKPYQVKQVRQALLRLKEEK